MPSASSCDTSVEETGPCTVDADGDGTYLTIQEAVDAASEGDVITVCPGVYDGVVIDRVGITLAGYGADSTCIFATAQSGIRVDNDVTVDISGFTVSGQSDGTSGGAVHFFGEAGFFHDLRITGVNSGYAVLNGAPATTTWQGVIFEHNDGQYAFLTWGGTIVRQSVFADNRVALAYFGMEGTSIEISNCIVSQSSLRGLVVDGAATVQNNVFYENAAALSLGRNAPRVRNNVALANGTGFDGELHDLDYDAMWDNDWDVVNDDPYPGDHGVVADPMFEDPANGDFRLKPGSPLIDAGDPDPACNDPDGTRNDIGLFGGPYGNWTPP